jgi:arylsulfatase
MLFDADQAGPGTGGHITLWADDKQIGEGDIPRTISLIFTTYAGMDISRDNGGVVDLDYEDRAPYAFTGTVRNVVFDLAPHSHDQELNLHESHAQAALAHGAAG